jgi:hypothetical protein
MHKKYEFGASISAFGRTLSDGSGDRHIPSPDEISAVISSVTSQVQDHSDLNDLWSSIALDSERQLRGYGFGHTPAEARASAWITAWWPETALQDIPRVVPEGWSFEMCPPGYSEVFRRTTTRV